MRQRGPARILCISDTVYDPKAKVLAYGTTRQFGIFRCSSSAAGLRCVNSTGDGFFLSKQHSYTFKEAASKNGAFEMPSGNIVCARHSAGRQRIGRVWREERPEAAPATRGLLGGRPE